MISGFLNNDSFFLYKKSFDNSRNDLDAHDIRKSLTHIIHSCNTSTGNAKHYAAAAALLRYMARSEMDSQSNTSNTRRATTSAVAKRRTAR